MRAREDRGAAMSVVAPPREHGYGLSDAPDWRAVSWEAHQRTIDIAGSGIRYVDYGSGDGPPVVFVHGIVGCWEHWLENLAPIACHRRVVAFDLPGFGESTMPSEPIGIGFYARVAGELCERLGLGRVVVVGNSLGGAVAADTAALFGDRVERLVLVSAGGDLEQRPASLRRCRARVRGAAVATARRVARAG